MLKSILEILSIPLMILNLLSGIVGGIWLAFLGEWRLIGVGIVLVLISHWILSFFMMLGFPIGLLGVFFYKKNIKILGHLFGYLSQAYTNFLIIGTCVFAFFVCLSYYGGEVGLDLVPYILWSWGMALGPWQFFASKEPDNEFSGITLFSASVFYFLLLVSVFIAPMVTLIVFALFGVMQLVVIPLFCLYVANQMQKSY